ncbi:MAG: RluA family pseudouridine synthase [Deltaproteobacteria bacterium]|nr:RluA family pseudouridine synthase [Deltaproteobacteria bacterium]
MSRTIWKWQVSTHVSKRADLLVCNAVKNNLGSWINKKADFVFSRNLIQKLIQSGRVTANEQQIKANSKLTQGLWIQIEFPEPEELNLIPTHIPLEVIYEDAHLLVVNKPPGLTVHPAPTQKENTLVHALLFHIKDLSDIGGKLRPGIVHRLDKLTSGALMVAKTNLAHQKLIEAFSERRVLKTYIALCYGSPKLMLFKLENLIGRNPLDRKKMIIHIKRGRKAISFIEKSEEYVLEKSPFAALLKIRIETGRQHQIRVQLTSAGHSILGDPVYGVPTQKQNKWISLPDVIKDLVKALPGQALHAQELCFKHPITGVDMKFVANPPQGFSNLLKALQRWKV